ncbi:MAG TPA: hypothetical protein VJK72_02970 [Candidatus Nanoarchaeia archaeon]|nr:hypothetical protein [Candidatus Nanoarchaeia archaeon]
MRVKDKKTLCGLALAAFMALQDASYAHGNGDGRESSITSMYGLSGDKTVHSFTGRYVVPIELKQPFSYKGFAAIQAGIESPEQREHESHQLFSTVPWMYISLGYPFEAEPETEIRLEYGVTESFAISDKGCNIIIGGTYRIELEHKMDQSAFCAEILLNHKYTSTLSDAEEFGFHELEIQPSITAMTTMGDVELRISGAVSLVRNEDTLVHDVTGTVGITLPVGGGLELALMYGARHNHEKGYDPTIGIGIRYFIH